MNERQLAARAVIERLVVRRDCDAVDFRAMSDALSDCHPDDQARTLNCVEFTEWISAHKYAINDVVKSGGLRKPCPTCGRAFT